MKTLLLVSIAVALCLTAACSKPQPSADAISASLTQFIKKDNPDAKLDGRKLLDSGSSGTLIITSFGYKDFTYTSKNGQKKTESGTGTATFDNISGKWLLDTVMINYGTPDFEVWNPKTEVK